MCGTYTLRPNIEAIVAARFIQSDSYYPGSYKIAPSTLNPVIVKPDDEETLQTDEMGIPPALDD